MTNVIVFGAPRSGTTYLLRCLQGLRETETKSGTLVPAIIPHLAGQYESNRNVRSTLRHTLRRSFDAYLSSDYHSRFEALEYWSRAPFQVGRLKHVLRRGARPLPERFVYKEPFFALSPEFVLEEFPEAKVVYLYRDGRDVANSLVETYGVLTDEKLTHTRSTEVRLGRKVGERYVPWWVDEGREEEFLAAPPYVRSIWMWKHMTQRCHQYFKTSDATNQVCQVQYEAFMRNPHIEGDRILEHLGADETWMWNRQLGQARTSSIGKYTKRPKEETRAGVRIAGGMLMKLGYTT